MLAALPTRNAALPMIVVLEEAKRQDMPLSTLLTRLPARFHSLEAQRKCTRVALPYRSSGQRARHLVESARAHHLARFGARGVGSGARRRSAAHVNGAGYS
ncbi:hypothetical protein NOVOSPHI9U_420460 [Novosphingobium sp. 9U]|nr:hypothetical protein NOVOSPHI9U_420460 [Novosphingobium sp. 9U]